MDSGDMLKQLLDKFTIEESVIQEELKLVQEQIEQLESRLGECSTSRNSLQDDRERVFSMMKRYMGGKFDPPPEVLARLDTIAAEAMARFDFPSDSSSAPVAVAMPVPLVEPSPPAHFASTPPERVYVAPEPELPVVQTVPVPELVAPVLQDIEPGRQTLRIHGVNNPVNKSHSEFPPMPDLSDEEPTAVEWAEPSPPAPPLQSEEIAEPPAPPLAPASSPPPPQPVAADSSPQEAPSAAAADNQQVPSSVDFGGEEEADLKSINDALRSLFR